jgi:hypothetical protein
MGAFALTCKNTDITVISIIAYAYLLPSLIKSQSERIMMALHSDFVHKLTGKEAVGNIEVVRVSCIFNIN